MKTPETYIYRGICCTDHFAIIFNEHDRYDIGGAHQPELRSYEAFSHPNPGYYVRTNELALLVVHGVTLENIKKIPCPRYDKRGRRKA